MPTVTQVNDLKINKLTKAQYDAAVQAGTIGENEISIITDLDATPQVDVMPAASAANKNHIMQYTGETTADYQNGYFYKSMSGGACTVTEYISAYEDQPSVMPTFTFERDVFDKYLEDNELAPNTGSSIRAERYTDEDTGDTYYKIIYNINSTDDELILDIENIENAVEVNKGFKKAGIISTFDEVDDDVWGTQIFESITMTLPNTSSYFWLQIDTQPIVDPLPIRKQGTENSFLMTNWDNELLWNTCENKIVPWSGGHGNISKIFVANNGNTNGKWSNAFVGSSIQNKTLCFGNDWMFNDENLPYWSGLHDSVIIGAAYSNDPATGQTSGVNKLVTIGQGSFARDNAVAVGYNAGATTNAIQLGTTGSSSVKTVNNDQNTFKVANANGNFEMMSADGTIPAARLADTTSAVRGNILTMGTGGKAFWGPSVSIPASTITLLTSNWTTDVQTGKINQTVTVQGVTANSIVFIGAAPASVTDWDVFGVLCVEQGTDQLKFEATNVPNNNITVNVVILA